jgi:hypothetical protein
VREVGLGRMGRAGQLGQTRSIRPNGLDGYLGQTAAGQ